MITVRELQHILSEAIKNGQGDWPVVMSKDAEGNGYNYWGGSYGAMLYDREYNGVVYSEEELEDEETIEACCLDDESTAELEDVFVIWPC